MASQIQFTMRGEASPDAPYVGPVKCTNAFKLTNIQEGIGVDQFDAMVCVDTSIGISSTLTVDLSTAEAHDGDPFAPTEIVAMYIENDGDGDLEMKPNAVDGWTGFLDADPGGTDTPKLVLPAKTKLMFYNGEAGAWPVSGTSKKIDFAEVGGSATASLKVQVWGRR